MRFYLKDTGGAYRVQVFDHDGWPLSSVMRGGTVGIDRASSIDARRSATAPVLPAQEWVIIWHISNFSNPVHGGPFFSPQIGYEDQLGHTLTIKWITIALNLGILLVMAGYHLVLFALRPKDKALLWFSLLCIEIAVRTFGTENFFGLLLPEADVWRAGHLVELLGFSLAIPTFALFLKAMFPQQAMGRFYKVFLVASGVYSAILLIGPLPLHFWATLGYEAVTLLLVVWGMAVLMRAIKDKEPLAWILTAGSIVLALCIVNDILYAELVFQSVDLTQYGQTVFILCQAIVIAIVNQKAHHAWRRAEHEKHAIHAEALRVSQENERLVREQNVLLERKVAERTEALVHAKEVAEEARRVAEEASRTKSTFLASMSHELRTPLSAILGYAQILQIDDDLPEKHRKSAITIYRSGEHLLLMINDLLDLAKIEAGKSEVHPSKFPLPSFLKNLVENARFHSKRSACGDIAIALAIPDDLPTHVYADERYLRQILENLLNNAIKFTETGSVTLRVSEVNVPQTSNAPLPDGYSSRKTFRFAVEDTGIGIPEEDLPKIFSSFYQIKHAHMPQNGSGLGLAISQRLVRLIGGELLVKSQVGQGTTFWFDLILPISDDRQTVSPFRMASFVTGYTGPPKTILIIEDNAGHRGFLRDMLEPLDFITKETDSGEKALDIIKDATPDLILVDIFLPGMDGFETMRQIRASANEPAIVVAISASPQMKQASIKAGCDDFLAKPIQVDLLLHCLGQHLHIEWTFIGSEDNAEE
jgi:signal transduction histidine kinase/ActR/RegA family two-component response regulator